MKKLIIIGAALAALHASLDAQVLNVTAPGYAGGKLFDSTAGFTITGLAADTNGDIYYLETDSTFSANTQLYKRTAANGYAVAVPLFDLGAPVFGSFVTLGSGKVFFGENSTNTLYAINPDGSGNNTLGTILNNYDAVFAGGSLFVSHNLEPSFLNPPKNRVSKYDIVAGGGTLTLGVEDTIIDTVSDYSGPVEMDASGALFYGATGANGIGDLYRFNAAEVAGAFGPTSLALDVAHRLIENGVNAYLAMEGGTALWQSNFGALNLIDTLGATSASIATSANFIGQLDAIDGEVFASVTDFATSRSAVYGVVPEAGTGALLLSALGIISLRRSRAYGTLHL